MIYNIDRVIKYIIYTHYYKTKIPHEELFQIGYLGYLKALQNVDGRGMSIKYASWYIRQEINIELKKANRYVNTCEDDIHRLYLIDNKSVFVYDDSMEKIKESLHILTVPERFIIHQKYFNDVEPKLTEIADSLGISKQAVHISHNRSIKKLQEVL